MFKLPDGSLRLIVQGLARLTLDEVVATEPYSRACEHGIGRFEGGRSARDRRSGAQHQDQFGQVVSLRRFSDDLQTS
jgi:hypothetical protein